LIAKPTADPSFELVPVAENTFIRRDQDIKYTFVKGDAGVRALQLAILRSDTLTAPKVSADALVPYEQLMAGNIDKAIEGYRQIKRERPNAAAISEERLNGLGYGFMRAKKLPEALVYFKLNVEFYPNSWNVYDSLAEAYMQSGEKDLAIANYKKSLKLNPGNTNATEMLKKLSSGSQ
jgi:tetratricopeptide (TPR) repeat protein